VTAQPLAPVIPCRAPFRVGEHREPGGISVRTASGADAPVRDMGRCFAVLEPVDRLIAHGSLPIREDSVALRLICCI
jgi:hypothetical protein